MAKESERKTRMKENFMQLNQKGYSIPEIAENFDLSFSTVYRSLQEIADINGVTRDSLLKLVRSNTEKVLREERKYVRVNVDELRQGFEDVGKAIRFLVEKVDGILVEVSDNAEYDI